MNYCSKLRVESKAVPGAVFVIKKMTELRRVQRELSIVDLRFKILEKREALNAAIKDRDEALASNLPDPNPRGTVERLNAEFGVMLHGEWYPAWIRWGLDSIDGYEIDGAPATVESLIAEGESALIEEIHAAILAASGLSPEETKNSPLPGDSADLVDGKTSSSTAPNVAPADGTASATASATSPAT